jgi:AcrR family transcriptional regulator
MARIAVDARRELLVEAAIRVMVRDGVAKATTRSIVAEAGMALAAFHYSFRSKQELLENVIRTITAHTLDQAVERLSAEGGVEDKVRAALDSYWQHLVANPGEHRVTYELTQYALRHPGLATVAKRQYEAYIEEASKLIDALAQSSDVTWTAPVPVIARYLIAVMDGLTLLWLNVGDDDAARAALELAGDHLISLIRVG